jgi:energy-coupling factor transporter ATP-binding protein EcfA2
MNRAPRIAGDSVAAHNPFAASRLRPGQIPYFFPPGDDLTALLERLARSRGRGQIIGSHGSGKSTLLAMLAAALRASGHQVVLLELHDGQRRLPAGWAPSAADAVRAGAESSTGTVHNRAAGSARLPCTLIFVDGYEQLGWLARWQLKRRCRRAGWGLVVTSHRPVGWPTLAVTRVDLDVARAVVDALARDFPLRPSVEDVSTAYARCGGDLREMLFDLYDRYEARRRNSTG